MLCVMCVCSVHAMQSSPYASQQQGTPAKPRRTPEAPAAPAAAAALAERRRARELFDSVVCFYLACLCLSLPAACRSRGTQKRVQSGDVAAPSSVGCMYGTAVCLSLAGRGTTEQPPDGTVQQAIRIGRVEREARGGSGQKQIAETTTDVTTQQTATKDERRWTMDDGRRTTAGHALPGRTSYVRGRERGAQKQPSRGAEGTGRTGRRR